MDGTDVKSCAIFLGPPGSGKSSVAEQLGADRRIACVNTGDIARRHIEKRTDAGEEIRDYVQKGELAPTPIIKKIVTDYADDLDEKYLIFDGFPRSREQLKAFGEVCRDIKCELKAIIIFSIDRETAIKRLTGRRICEEDNHIYNIYYNPPPPGSPCAEDSSKLVHRDDDEPETVEKRFDEYSKKAKPLADFFRAEKSAITYDIKSEKELEDLIEETFASLKKAGMKDLPV
jgi:adenylate kinase